MNNKISILIIEDEMGISNFMKTTLKNEGYKVHCASSGVEGLSMLSSHCLDVVLLDMGLPDIDGIEVIKQVREWSVIPIIVVSARGEEEDKVKALDCGADDYVTKPFGTSELLARIRTAYRHSIRIDSGSEIGSFVFKAADLTVDLKKRIVKVSGSEVHLTQIEFKILALLVQNAGRVLTYDSIIKEIWGPWIMKENQILRVNMANIRRKIENNPANPKYIFTEVGVGYRLIEED